MTKSFIASIKDDIQVNQDVASNHIKRLQVSL